MCNEGLNDDENDDHSDHVVSDTIPRCYTMWRLTPKSCTGSRQAPSLIMIRSSSRHHHLPLTLSSSSLKVSPQIMMMMEARRESLEVGGEILWGESVTRERGQEGMPCCKYQPCDDPNGGRNNVMMPSLSS